MTNTIKPLMAIALGLSLALGPAFWCSKRHASKQSDVRVVPGCLLTLVPPDDSCTLIQAPNLLLVTSAEIGQKSEPLTWQSVSEGERILAAEFSDSWAERKSVAFIGKDWSKAIDVHILFATDYGNYLGAIDASRSSLHKHKNHLCFDLVVQRLSFSGVEERWRASLSMRGQ